MVQKMTLLQKIINNSGFLNHVFQRILDWHYELSAVGTEVDEDMAYFLELTSEDKARELAEIFKVISNRLLDFGMDHTERYLSGKENP